MKLLTAIVQPPKYQAVVSALTKFGSVGLSLLDATGFGRQRGQTPTFRGNEYEVQFLRKTVIEIALGDDMVEKTLETIQNAARTGSEGCIGDGKIFVVPIEDAVDIGSGQRGPDRTHGRWEPVPRLRPLPVAWTRLGAHHQFVAE